MTRVSWSRMYTLPATSWSVSVRSPTKVTWHTEGLTLAISHENNGWNEMRLQRQRLVMIAACVCLDVWSLIRTSAVFPPWGCGSARTRGTNKVTWQQFCFICWWLNHEPTKRRAINIDFTTALKSIFGLLRHCEAFPVQIQPCLAHKPWTQSKLLIWSKLCCKFLRWSRVATKPA